MKRGLTEEIQVPSDQPLACTASAPAWIAGPPQLWRTPRETYWLVGVALPVMVQSGLPGAAFCWAQALLAPSKAARNRGARYTGRWSENRGRCRGEKHLMRCVVGAIRSNQGTLRENDSASR